MSNRALATVDDVLSGVDWISATLGRDEIDDQVWMSDALHALFQVQLDGNAYKSRKLLGFDGFECGGCFVGSNDKMHYAQFTGQYADMAYEYLEHPKVHISRIDLQVTVKYSTELQKEGRYQYAHAIHHNKTLPNHRQRVINIILGADGSDTVYIGAATSDTRARMYNKQRQSLDVRYERAWRYEVVYRNQYAAPVYRRVVSQDNARTTIIIPEVVQYFRARGIEVLGMGNWGGNALPAPKAARTDVERKLRWIEQQVVPTIRKLSELGYTDEVMDLLSKALVGTDPHSPDRRPD